MRHYSRGLLRHLAREMRSHPTMAERRVWELVRDRRLLGLRFKRQVVIEGLIVDFYCRNLRLAVELDGPVHRTPDGIARDRARDMHLQSRGVRVFHLWNEEATPHKLCDVIWELTGRSPSPFAGEGDRG